MHTKKRSLVLVGVILLLAISMSPSGQIANNGVPGQNVMAENLQQSGDKHYEPTWESLAQHSTPEWFEDAVLGIYFHWGVYSVAEMGEWYAQRMYCEKMDRYHSGNIDYHKKTYGDPCTEFGYKDFVPMFKAEKWDPDFWAELFENAGADFAGPVAEQAKFEISYLSVDKTTLEPDKSFSVSSKRHKNKERKKNENQHESI